jgi:hypothetical protein
LIARYSFLLLFIIFAIGILVRPDVAMGATMSRILLAGSDSRLLGTRAAVLSKTGAAVIHRNATETLSILDRESFDLVVLCHSLFETDVAQIVAKVHQKIPSAKILMVTSALDGIYANKQLDAISTSEPSHLIACAKELLQATLYASPAKDREGAGQTRLVAD